MSLTKEGSMNLPAKETGNQLYCRDPLFVNERKCELKLPKRNINAEMLNGIVRTGSPKELKAFAIET